MAIAYFDPKTSRGYVDCGRCLRARFRYMGEVCTLVLFIQNSNVTSLTDLQSYVMIGYAYKCISVDVCLVFPPPPLSRVLPTLS